MRAPELVKEAEDLVGVAAAGEGFHESVVGGWAGTGGAGAG